MFSVLATLYCVFGVLTIVKLLWVMEDTLHNMRWWEWILLFLLSVFWVLFVLIFFFWCPRHAVRGY